jgi:hypothetical protein
MYHNAFLTTALGAGELPPSYPSTLPPRMEAVVFIGYAPEPGWMLWKSNCNSHTTIV